MTQRKTVVVGTSMNRTPDENKLIPRSVSFIIAVFRRCGRNEIMQLFFLEIACWSMVVPILTLLPYYLIPRLEIR
jgi:hypothetical protein